MKQFIWNGHDLPEPGQWFFITGMSCKVFFCHEQHGTVLTFSSIRFTHDGIVVKLCPVYNREIAYILSAGRYGAPNLKPPQTASEEYYSNIKCLIRDLNDAQSYEEFIMPFKLMQLT